MVDSLKDKLAYFDELVKEETDLANQQPVEKTASEALQAIAFRARENGVNRTGWFMTTTEWMTSNPPKGIYWNANPTDITWSMPQRAAVSKTMMGTVTHVWPNSNRKTLFDEFRLTLSLQTGNLMPVYVGGGTSNGTNFLPSGGIVNFYDFMQLVDAPKLTAGDDKNPPRANNVYIQYHSNLFPQLTLMGQFDPSTGISFTDSSRSPASPASWSASFIVYDCTPRLSSTEGGQQSNAALLAKWIDEKIRKATIPTPASSYKGEGGDNTPLRWGQTSGDLLITGKSEAGPLSSNFGPDIGNIS